jgi:hypothetical protein
MVEVGGGEMLEKIRADSAPAELKRSLAKGIFPLAPAEMMEILILLAGEEEYREDAVKSLRRMPKGVVLGVCGSPDTSSELLARLVKLFSRNEEFLERIIVNPACDDASIAFAATLPFATLLEIIGRNHARLARAPDIVANLQSNPASPGSVLRLWEEEVERRQRRTAREDAAADESEETADIPPVLVEDIDEKVAEGEEKAVAAVEEKRETIQQLLRTLTAGQKVALAGKGNSEVRKILVRDKNRLVCVKVLQNPRITDSEVEQYAKSTNVSDDVLRFIGSKREWAKLVPVVRALVQNPKTPLGLSLTHLKKMSVRELDGLSKNRNIPEALRKSAKKLFKVKAAKKNQ